MRLLKLSVFLFFQLSLLSGAIAQYNFKTYLVNAKKDILDSNYTEAIKKLNICLQAQPNDNEAYFYRGICKFSLYDHIGAEEDFSRALSGYSPYYYDALHNRSLVRYRLSNYNGAIEDINKLIANDPGNAGFYLSRAFNLLAINNFNASIADCNMVLKLKWLGEDVYLCKAAAEDALGDYDNAMCDYDLAISINPLNVDLYVRRGMTKYKLENFKEAIEDYNYAIKLDSTSSFAYFNRAEAEIKLNDNKKAMLDYNTVLALDPRNAYAYFNRGVLLSNLHKYKSAIEDFDKVLLLNPDNIQALLNRAKLKENIKDYNGALKDYDKVIELYPYITEAFYKRAQVKFLMKDNAGAQEDLAAAQVMREVFNSKNETQLSQDSALLVNLMRLNADFNSASTGVDDTVKIGLLPLFYIGEKAGETKSRFIYSQLLENINKHTNNSFYFTNHQNVYVINPVENQSPANIDSILVDEQNEDMLLAMAIQHTNMQLLNDARDYFDKIITFNPNNAIAYFGRAVNTCREIELMSSTDEPYIISGSSGTFIQNEKNEKCKSALSDFSKALQLQPNFYYAYYNRANVKCILQDFYGALKDYETSVKLNHDFADAYYNKGFLLYYLNNREKACIDFSKAGELGLPESYNMMKRYCKK